MGGVSGMVFKPWAYQKFAIRRILDTPALGLFLDCGLGKTVITLSAVLDLRYNRFAVSKILVVSPKKVAQSTWAAEIKKWEHLKLLRVSTVLGTASQRIRALNTPADIYVTSRDLVCWLVDYYKNAWPFDMVILDESSSFKNHQAKRTKALSHVRPHIKRLILLTGTPSSNGITDIWSQIHLLDGGERLEKRIGQFREKYLAPDKRNREHIFSYVPKPGAEEAIYSRISDICVSMKAEDYLELPPLIVTDVPVALDKKAEEAYQKLEHDMLLEVDEATIDAGSAAVLTNKLLQLASGAVYDENKNPVEIHGCKIEAFMELIESFNGDPVLVFYNFRHDKTRLQAALKSTGLRVREMTGPDDVEAWNVKEVDVLLAQPASAGYGINLQHGGRRMIWYGLTWSLELYQQACARLYRQGQTGTVFIHRLLVSGSVDEDVAAALEDKSSTQDRLMEALKARIQKAHA